MQKKLHKGRSLGMVIDKSSLKEEDLVIIEDDQEIMKDELHVICNN